MDGSEIDGFQIRVDYSITDSAHKSVLPSSPALPLFSSPVNNHDDLAGQLQECISTMGKPLVQVWEEDQSSEAGVTSGEGEGFSSLVNYVLKHPQAGHWGFIEYRPLKKTEYQPHSTLSTKYWPQKFLKSSYLHISRQKWKCLLGQDFPGDTWKTRC